MAAFSFSFRDYWTRPTIFNSIYVNFGVNYDGKTYGQIYSVNPKDWSTIWIDDIRAGVWLDRWYMKYDTPRGIIEYADAYPKKAYQLFSQWSVLRFVSGQEIFWGGNQKIGDTVTTSFVVNPFTSTFPTPPGSGTQTMKFLTQYSSFKTKKNVTYKDVIVVTYDQNFNGKNIGARYWFARGKGIIQLSWRNNGQDIALSLNNPLVSTFSNVPPLKA